MIKLGIALFGLLTVAAVTFAEDTAKTFTFKGFGLGMPLEDAEKLIKEKCGAAFGDVVSQPVPPLTRSLSAAAGSKATYERGQRRACRNCSDKGGAEV